MRLMFFEKTTLKMSTLMEQFLKEFFVLYFLREQFFKKIVFWGTNFENVFSEGELLENILIDT